MSNKSIFPINLDRFTDKERHNYILNHYVRPSIAESESRKHKRDIDVIRENHRFLWDEEDAADIRTLSWEQRLALRYYRKLFKEYCIADLTRYKENKIALRWRTEEEVVTGIGQFQCGSRHCGERENLRSWEVNFKYIEEGAPQNALVKVGRTLSKLSTFCQYAVSYIFFIIIYIFCSYAFVLCIRNNLTIELRKKNISARGAERKRNALTIVSKRDAK